ncbi:preprotein translocase subunit YajC [Spirillospora sp. NPDC048911]|uniref:preprotein translocase subunit YajC n=1 Tax=Spirillospora sp. NPDC048911 TaxID=3364527 RepID=UPI00371FA13D
MGGNNIIAASGGGGGAFNLLLLLAVPLVFYFLLIRPQSKRRKEQLQMQSSIEPGVRVMTTSGMYATVVSSDDDGLVLEIAPGVEARFVKQAIMNVVKDDEADDLEDDEDGDEDGTPADDSIDLSKDDVDLSKDGKDVAGETQADAESKPAAKAKASSSTEKPSA